MVMKLANAGEAEATKPCQNQLTPTIKQLIILCFLSLKMKIHAHLVGVLKDDFPLGALAHVDSCPIHSRVASVHEDIIVVAFNIHGQEAEGIQALGGKIVDSADDLAAFSACPCGIAGLIIGCMWRPRFPDQCEVVRYIVNLNYIFRTACAYSSYLRFP
jgi:hypothetical protein